MRTPLRAAAMACLALVSVWTAAPARAADPPPALAANATDAQVQSYVAFWVQGLQSAADANAVLTARDKLVDGYKAVAEKSGYTFADAAASRCVSLLSKGFGEDTLGKVKEINLAMALSQMPQVPVQPALEAMAASKDPAVRLFAWKGYRDAREAILGQGQLYTRKGLAAVAKAAQTEDSGPVLEQIFRMLQIDGAKPNIVKKEDWDLAQKETLATLEANWRKWCLQVLGGDEEIADAMRAAVKALVAHTDPGNKAQRTKMLQELVDLAFAAGNAFVQGRGAGGAADAPTKLLRDCEDALNALMGGAPKDFIKKPMDDARINNNPNWILLWVQPGAENKGVTAWADLLKSEGVAAPNFGAAPAPKPAAAAPATAPAAAPK